MTFQALPGFRDFFPHDLAQRGIIFARWREIARRYGFEEYDGPPLEPLELYTRKSGDEIVGQLYTFSDRGGRDVSLRPEMTPTLARMVAAKASALRKPVRWFSIPQLFRYERQQKGRLREHFQLNMDIVGEADVSADAELLASAIDIVRSFGLGPADVRARVSDRRLLQGLLSLAGVDAARLPGVYQIVDKLGRETRQSIERKLGEAGFDAPHVARIYEVLGSTDLQGLRDRYSDVPALREDFARLDRYFGYLQALGVGDWVAFDLSVVRGLAYYTGIVFELFDTVGEFRAICGGGRYDGLLESLGGVNMPALGFGMGDVVLAELLRSRGLLPVAETGVDVWIAFGDAGGLTEAMRLAAKLRQRGRSVEYALGGQQLSRQRKAAHAAGAREMVTLTPEELARGEAIVRRMSDGTEERVQLDAWAEGEGR